MQTALLLLALLSSSVPRADVELPQPEERRKQPTIRNVEPNRAQRRRMKKLGLAS